MDDQMQRSTYTLEELIIRNMQTMGAVVRYGSHVVVAEYSYTGAYEGLIYQAADFHQEGSRRMEVLRLETRSAKLYRDSGHAILWGLEYLCTREQERSITERYK